MNELQFDGWRLAYDADSTREAYRAAERYSCDCVDCRNFFEVRGGHFPEELQALFRTLGVDPERPAEVYGVAPTDGRTQLYEGFYHFVGAVIEDPGVRMSRLVAENAEWQIFFHDCHALALPEFGDQPLVQFEFSVRLPWRLPASDVPKR